MFATAESRQAPKLTIARDGTLLTTFVQRSGRDAIVQLTMSTDHGKTWTAPKRVGTVLYSTIGLQRQPTTVRSVSGTLHSIWENVKVGNQLAIFHTRSTDDGQTWTTPTPVYNVSDGRSQDFSSIAIGPNGYVYVSFLSPDIDDQDGMVHVLVTRSTDDGATWQRPVRADAYDFGGACECCLQNIAVSDNNVVAVAFRTNIANRRDVFLSVSRDSGQSFNEITAIQTGTWTIDACPSTGPSIVFDAEGRVHASWRDTRDDVGYDVAYYTRYLPGSKMAIQNIDVSSRFADQAEYPVVSTSTNGAEIAVIFESSRGVQIARDNSDGSGFRAEVVDNFAIRAAWPGIVWTHDDFPLAVWQATRGDHYDIMVSRDQVTGVGELGNGEWGMGNWEWGTGNCAYDLLGRRVDERSAGPLIEITTDDNGRSVRRLIWRSR